MKLSSLLLLSVLLAPPLFADSGERLIPAGSLISCTTAEPRLSSRTTAVGDPVLCQVGHSERYGRNVLPYNSYLVGRFEDFKDPGHFVGKGWMELKFDHMVIEPDTVVPVNARVVDVPGYKVDNQGRILGKGHAVRDVVMWSIPVLWPVDLLMLPMRGPRPTLKEETQLTLKVMDDLAVPTTQAPQRDPYGLVPRGGDAYAEPPAPTQDQQPAPDMGYAQQPYPPQDQQAPPPAMAYAPPVAYPPPMMYAPPVVIAPRVLGYGYGYGYGYGRPAYGYGARMAAPRMLARGYGSRMAAPRMGGYGYAMGARGGMASRGGYRGR